MRFLKIYLREIIVILLLVAVPVGLLVAGKIHIESAIAFSALVISIVSIYSAFLLGPKFEVIDTYFEHEGPHTLASHSLIIINHGSKTGVIKDVKIVPDSNQRIDRVEIDSIDVNVTLRDNFSFSIKPQEAQEVECLVSIDTPEKELKYHLELETAHGDVLKTEKRIYHTNWCPCIGEDAGQYRRPKSNCEICGGTGFTKT